MTRIDENGRGYINIIRLTDIQDRPKLFSTFMLSLLAEIYGTFPEQGDSERPELIMFIDEAHLIFNEASKALLEQIESIVKLIRSKGIGLYFVTQNPTDVPDAVLSQTGRGRPGKYLPGCGSVPWQILLDGISVSRCRLPKEPDAG
mgnify:CR=1 FL=1